MITYPLESISIEEAIDKQHKFVECTMHYFKGSESLTRGDLGVHQPINQPVTTRKAEQAIAEFFDQEDCILVRGSGTGAIRYGLSSLLKPGSKILIHDAPIYSTTKTSFEMLGINTVVCDFNNLADIEKTLNENDDIEAALVQYSRQKIDDSYDLEEVIEKIKASKDIPVLVDDNYAVMKVKKIGAECGGDLSCFSTFKLQGPEGIGCVVGKHKYIEKIRKMHYSGGCQTQGYEALEVIRGLTYAPVMLAITAKTITEVYEELSKGKIKGVKNVYIANAQSKVLLIEFEEKIAKKVLIEAEKLGALPNPVGSESKYEIAPLFYRVSGTFRAIDETIEERMIRVNPNRASSKTILKIIEESISKALGE